MTAIKKNAQIPSEEKKNVFTISKTAAVPQAEEVTPQEAPSRELKTPTLEELKRRAEIVFLLREKHTRLTEKRASLDKFSISHEKENATATVEDANGLEFTSSSPKTIGKLLEFWKDEFDEAIAKIEEELKKNFELAA